MAIPENPLLAGIVKGFGEAPIFAPGDSLLVSGRAPVGHYSVPSYVRARVAVVEAVIEPAAINNEEEGFGRNADSKRHYYRVALALTDLWPGYRGSAGDALRIEIFEDWLEKI
jgi:hypothetical protein